MKIIIELEVEDKILCEARKHRDLFDHLSTQVMGDAKRRAFDELVKAVEKAHGEGLCAGEGGVIT